MRRIEAKRLVAALTATGFALAPIVPAPADDTGDKIREINHIVVIYQENHSFDNLYGGWEGVRGREDANLANTLQVSQGGSDFDCLLQVDVNLTSPPLLATCANAAAHG